MSTNPKPKRTVHDLEFKKQAVQMLTACGRPLAQVARELALPAWQLRGWKNRLERNWPNSTKISKPYACVWPNWNA